MTDPFQNNQTGLESPITKAAPVTPDNATDLPTTPRAIWVGTGGDVALVPAGQATGIILQNIPDGTLIPIRAKRITVAGTTASNIVALW